MQNILIMKTRTKVLSIFFALCLMILSGSASASQDADAMQAYAAVLNNEAAFFSVDPQGFSTLVRENTLLQDFLGSFYAENHFTVDTFAVVDMDGDEISEVILYIKPGDLLEVLHYENGTVYGNMLMYRAMWDIRQDGTFQWSENVSTGGNGRLTFSGADYEYIQTADASQADAVVWHEFSPENIAEYVK